MTVTKAENDPFKVGLSADDVYHLQAFFNDAVLDLSETRPRLYRRRFLELQAQFNSIFKNYKIIGRSLRILRGGTRAEDKSQ